MDIEQIKVLLVTIHTLTAMFGFLFLSSKRKGTLDDFMVAGTAWFLWEVIFILQLIYIFINRKKLKWLKRKWFQVAVKTTYKYLTKEVKSVINH